MDNNKTWWLVLQGSSMYSAKRIGRCFATLPEILAACGLYCTQQGDAILVYGKPRKAS